MVEPGTININDGSTTTPLISELPSCSFSGNPADFYIGLSGKLEGDQVRIVGAISAQFVETAILKVMGQGVNDIHWPVILDLNNHIVYHSYQAHTKGLSAVLGWKQLQLINTETTTA
ncbi:hypothetical protein [Arenibacter certesii]|uniref:Uncharacterized protein n=1 Tax=Arenibacter certesii TaxID=228955 RepID=A0A918J4Y8_9FLAO|nr:hypothetical protein [Arenibacter certesii]GGW48711.1 hypothetical protein GCM10007383_35930 [Arenibacter certesii]